MNRPATDAAYATDIPARLDRLPWSRFHWLVVLALGAAWSIDGLEVTLKGAVSAVLQDPRTLALDSAEIGALASFYLTGAVMGALLGGYLTDRYGRTKLLFVTLGIYLSGTFLTAFAWDFDSLAACRWLTGLGIGGEYTAINSAIDELVPARVRGRVALAVNGSFWIGAALGSGATLILLDPQILPVDVGWRAGFAIGAVIGVFVLAARRYVPESPRWLAIHGYPEKAEAAMAEIEARIVRETAAALESPGETLVIRPQRRTGFELIVSTMLSTYRARSFLGFVLIAAQAFLYNAIFFTYALVLTRFYEVPAARTGIYLLPFAVGNFLGPLLLGPLFDSKGRRSMIAATYALSGLLLFATGILFSRGYLSAELQTLLWSVIFFFASAAASSAYLTVSEIFPLELRALAIALFFAIGTAAGGILAPWFFGLLIGTGSRNSVFVGYALGAGLMIIAAIVAARYAVRAERAPLERVARPLAAEKSPRAAGDA
ncbi:MAG TPA: MFS transporter [Burkholderiales bacterium]|nr:MFS transporter [Burkholderiales bacterium]